MAARKRSAKAAQKRRGRKPKQVATVKKGAAKTAARRKAVSYPLEQLFTDQDEDFVIDCIAPVLAWVPGKSKTKSQA